MMKRYIGAFLTVLLLMGSLTGCGGSKQVEAQVFAMDTVMFLTACNGDGEAALQNAEAELYRLESMLSRTRENSQVTLLNQASEDFGKGQTVEVGDEVCGLIEQARTFSRVAGGALDITLAPVSSAWGFTKNAYRVPESGELEVLLTHVGMEHVHTDAAAGTAWLDEGTQVDLGGIAKGYASDRVAAIYRQFGVTSGTVSLGGNVWACGTRPDGKPWVVGIQDPNRTEEADAYVGKLHLSDAFAVTSGGYQRYFEEGGVTYHHILNPATGYPAESGLTSVTVVAAESGTMCDAFSTALFVMGEERALDFWRSGAYDFDLVLVTDDGRVLVTDGIADAFEETEGSGYVYKTVS
ncbi:thiamine biosynthesis lipoprotein [Oscillibacter sp. PC13]|uniref:FAD:protein FMN transferase n=1 Tax=Oscillibacter sp. PC13 TaxID=1855299 RepID=UPI0008E98329|nr:FAD:protein FMN transferase [Oscillibacter sp. PC13]SFP18386.1 thiamine biosynthesis lipoprotein [Oscillibacter sp. PC13]